jgi:Protein of unknown function (DUF1090)
MKSTVVAITLCLLLSQVQASTVTDTCDARRIDLERQMATAGANNNFDQVNSLQAALNQLNADCTPNAIAQKHADEVAKYQRRLDDRLGELRIAVEYHSNAEAVAKHQRKVDEARAELDRVKAKGDQ